MRSSIIIYAIATSWATASALSTHALPAPRNITPKDVLLDLVQRAPHNVPTGQRLTRDILDTVRLLERQCPTRDSEVATKMAGSWELLWTAQDSRRLETYRPFPNTFLLSPLEQQAETTGRKNPFLPLELQNQLEAAGLLTTSTTNSRSMQYIDIHQSKVRNTVVMKVPGLGKVGVAVDINFYQDLWDYRKIMVRLTEVRCRKFDFILPLGMFGPRGWLRTVYIDDNLRVSRGHKGSVYVLRRKGSTSSTSSMQ